RRVEDLEEPGVQNDRAYRVNGARVVFADYDRLRADFPWLRTEHLAGRHADLLRHEGPRQEERAREIIDAWLLEHAALISESQVGQAVVNTPIPYYGEPVDVYRLPRGGRAFSVPVQADPAAPLPAGEPAEGLLNLKGVGVGPGITPRHGGTFYHHD